MTEYLYDKDDPKSNLRSPITGIETFNYGVPNLYERAEMVARAVAKQNDGDLTRFVMQSKKPRDDAQRYRALKNITRFHKNPFGYLYWKMAPHWQANRVRFLYVLLAYHMYSTFMMTVWCRSRKVEMIEYYAYVTGRSSDMYRGLSATHRMPQDRKKCYVRYSNFHQMRRNKQVGMMHLPWWCRDQNFRKYFEMRKKHGIRPALSGFKHEPIHAEYIHKATRVEQIKEEYIHRKDPFAIDFSK